jgi:hypothetical protein
VSASIPESCGSLPLGREAKVLVGGGERQRSGASLEQAHGVRQLINVVAEQSAGVGSDRGERRNARVQLGAPARVRDGALGELAVTDGKGHSHDLWLVGRIQPEPLEHLRAVWLARRAEPLVSLSRIAVGCRLQTQQPGRVTANPWGGLVQHRLGDLARLANLPAVAGVKHQSPERDQARGVHDGDDGWSVGIEPAVQQDGRLVDETKLQEHLSPRDLGDVQEPGEPALERLGDDAVDRLELPQARPRQANTQAGGALRIRLSR